MIIPRQSIIHCHAQEFCVEAIGVKLLLKPIFKLTDIKGGSNMTGTDLYVNKPHCAAAVRP